MLKKSAISESVLQMCLWCGGMGTALEEIWSKQEAGSYGSNAVDEYG